MAGNSTAQGPGGTTFRVEDIGGSVLTDVQKPHGGSLGLDGGPGNVVALGGGVFVAYFGANSIPSTGVQVYSGACVAISVQLAQSSGGTVFPFLYDSLSAGANLSKPYVWLGSSANNSVNNYQIGAPGFGAPFTTGIWFQMSGTASSFSDTGSTLFTANFVYWHP